MGLITKDINVATGQKFTVSTVERHIRFKLPKSDFETENYFYGDYDFYMAYDTALGLGNHVMSPILRIYTEESSSLSIKEIQELTTTVAINAKSLSVEEIEYALGEYCNFQTRDVRDIFHLFKKMHCVYILSIDKASLPKAQLNNEEDY